MVLSCSRTSLGPERNLICYFNNVQRTISLNSQYKCKLTLDFPIKKNRTQKNRERGCYLDVYAQIIIQGWSGFIVTDFKFLKLAINS